jgi:hypothetical protein
MPELQASLGFTPRRDFSEAYHRSGGGATLEYKKSSDFNKLIQQPPIRCDDQAGA